MSEEPRALDPVRLRGLLAQDPLVSRLELLDVVDSTNDVVRELAARGASAGLVVVADCQRAGRGRLGRAWHSPSRLGLYASVLLRPQAAPHELTRFTLAAAVAAGEACRAQSPAAVTLSWPNDLTWRGLKLGGVLAELRSVAGRATDLVVGLGLNVGHAQADFPAELAERATSLRMAASRPPPAREYLLATYLRTLGEAVGLLERDGWAAVARRFLALAPEAVGRDVVVSTRLDGESTCYAGVTAGLDELGALRVRRGDGQIAVVRLAESVRFV